LEEQITIGKETVRYENALARPTTGFFELGKDARPLDRLRKADRRLSPNSR
jgi:hypothetical protein